MRIVPFDDPRAFRDRTREFLLENEADGSVQLGIIERLAAGGLTSALAQTLERPLLWTVEDEAGAVRAVAVQTRADTMLVSRGTGGAMGALANRLLESGWAGRWLYGVRPSIGELIERLGPTAGRAPRRVMGLRTLELREVIDPAPAPGAMRPCGEADRERLARWCVAFARDVGEPDDAGGDRAAGALLADRRAFFWDDGGPVAMAACAGPTPNGVRINFVYTPPENRRKGYASNLVAALSRQLLAGGKRFCFLNTDQANPTSNHVYEAIGYRGVCENEKWEVDLAGG